MIAATASLVAAEDIDPVGNNSQYAWGENVGWINAEPSGQGGPGINVLQTRLTGYMWGENIGWINLHCLNNNTCGTAQYGVTNDFGKLGGYAWGENVGWISFCDQDTPGVCKTAGSTYRVTINLTDGVFSGFAWGENIGWISFSDDAPVAYKVQTDMNDGDTDPGPADNCPWDANENQLNTDNAPLTTPALPPNPAPPNDTTIANSDLHGDACDEDDDNDAIPDANEAAGCNGGTNLSTTNGDTDGDRRRDGAECALGSNPNNASSIPAACPAGTDLDGDQLCAAFETSIGTNPNDVDTDDDGITDGVEYRGYTTSPTQVNTDGDLCGDAAEVVSVNVDNVVNSIDLGIVASVFSRTDRPVQDVNKNGNVNSSDLFLVAVFFNLPC
jgi:hypothetical protein